jgi:hypothetical protein
MDQTIAEASRDDRSGAQSVAPRIGHAEREQLQTGVGKLKAFEHLLAFLNNFELL